MFYNMMYRYRSVESLEVLSMGEQDYKEEILELINGCNNVHWLRCIYAYVKKLLK